VAVIPQAWQPVGAEGWRPSVHVPAWHLSWVQEGCSPVCSSSGLGWESYRGTCQLDNPSTLGVSHSLPMPSGQWAVQCSSWGQHQQGPESGIRWCRCRHCGLECPGTVEARPHSKADRPQLQW